MPRLIWCRGFVTIIQFLCDIACTISSCATAVHVDVHILAHTPINIIMLYVRVHMSQTYVEKSAG